ncbi:hypothetical protein BU17DRAFT_100765 [Hysterangium stoloniferum]|nr:hypothetical protein BU17DRAFT_100765 [Hysterangium stoloniferum]
MSDHFFVPFLLNNAPNATPSTNPRILAGYAPYGRTRKDENSYFKSGPAASTTEERRQLLLDDPYIRDVQPEQVTCARCSKTVRLQKGKMYHLAHWLDHRWRQQPRPRCRTLLERKTYLEADPDALVVKEDYVVCGRCNKEVRLRKNRPYGLSCWKAHKLSYHKPSQSPTPPASSSFLPQSTYDDGYKTLKADSLVLRIDSSSVKCANCLRWIDIGHRNDFDMNAWRQHRDGCISTNHSEYVARQPSPPRFHARHADRPHYSLSKASFDPADDSSDAEECPRTIHRPHHSLPDYGPGCRRYRTSLPPIESPDSPPPLSFSTATSTSTSVASTPMTSPQFHRKVSLFPNSRHLPLPEHGLSRLLLPKERQSPPQSALGLHLNPHSSFSSPKSDMGTMPPPFLEPTPISLPLPERYWRFDSVE